MATGLFRKLPTELLGEIGGALSLSCDDRRRLSEVDSRLRQILVPGLFTTIRFSDLAHFIAQRARAPGMLRKVELVDCKGLN
ncbi:hypothetical protein PG984_010129 [Apiospora sp. TS-2023a]